MSDQFTLKLNNPITEEQWDAITDVDFDHTEEVFFHTKHGKDVTFVKKKKGKWNCGDDMFEYGVCSSCKWDSGEAWEYAKKNFRYCPNCGARMER